MPRGPRLDSAGLLHHVRLRGVERRDLFLDDLDREDFLARLERACIRDGAVLLAWCLMTNHVHLAIRTGERPLACTMRSLLTGYAMAFNRRHARDGHLFQNRYKSTVVEEEPYLLALVRYIHLNPVAAGLVTNVAALADYKWAGHGALLGRSARPFQAVDEVLGRFGTKAGAARRELLRFMGDEAAAGEQAGLFEGGGLERSVGGAEALAQLRAKVGAGLAEPVLSDARILGGNEKVRALLALEEQRLRGKAMSQEQRQAAMRKILGKVCERAGLTAAELTGSGRRRDLVRWRRVAAYLCVAHAGASATETGRLLGLSVPSVLTAMTAGPQLLSELRVGVRALLK